MHAVRRGWLGMVGWGVLEVVLHETFPFDQIG